MSSAAQRPPSVDKFRFRSHIAIRNRKLWVRGEPQRGRGQLIGMKKGLCEAKLGLKE